jgi:hypothetical protein
MYLVYFSAKKEWYSVELMYSTSSDTEYAPQLNGGQERMEFRQRQ